MPYRTANGTAVNGAGDAGPVIAAKRGAGAKAGEVRYTVLSERPPERRRHVRRCVHFATGKLAGARFISECRVIDRSESGLKVMLARENTLPERLRFFDDRDGALASARVVWREGRVLGLQLFARTASAHPIAALLGETLYAL